jgi:hypothetical protein
MSLLSARLCDGTYRTSITKYSVKKLEHDLMPLREVSSKGQR